MFVVVKSMYSLISLYHFLYKCIITPHTHNEEEGYFVGTVHQSRVCPEGHRTCQLNNFACLCSWLSMWKVSLLSKLHIIPFKTSKNATRQKHFFHFHSQVTLGFTVYSYAPPIYGSYVYPTWAVAMGWCIAATSLLPVPLYFIYKLKNSKGAFMEVNQISVIFYIELITNISSINRSFLQTKWAGTCIFISRSSV